MSPESISSLPDGRRQESLCLSTKKDFTVQFFRKMGKILRAIQDQLYSLKPLLIILKKGISKILSDKKLKKAPVFDEDKDT